MPARTIRETLLRELFTKPRAIDRELYAKSRSILFPNEEDFVEFLRTESSQEQMQRARSILLDLVFSSACPPPSHLLLNLFDSQQSDKEVYGSEKYVPRDHFAHLVHLYLLGIYIFACHNAIHRHCAAELQNERRRLRVPGRSGGAPGVYELFASVWTQFVLYHDVCYPFERISPGRREENQSATLLKPFTRIVKSIGKDLSFRAAARLIAFRQLTADADETFDEIVISHLDDISSQEGHPIEIDATASPEAQELLVALEEWRDASYLPRVTGAHDLRTIFSCLDGAEMCAALEDRTGAPIIIALGSPTKARCLEIQSKASKRRETSVWLSKQQPEAVFRLAPTPGTGYLWRFFIRNVKQIRIAAVNGFIGNKIEQFDRISTHIEERQSFRATRTKGFDSSDRLGALAYLAIVEMRGYFKHDEEEESLPEILRQQINTAARNQESAVSAIPQLASEIVRKYLHDWLQVASKRRKILDGIRTNGSAQVARSVWQHLSSESATRNFQNRLAAVVEHSVVEPIDLARETRECTNEIRKRIEQAVAPNRRPNTDPLSAYCSSKQRSLPIFKADFTLSQVVDHWATVTQFLDTRLRKRHLDSFADLVKGYIPPWAKQSTSDPPQDVVIDHGFAGAIVALTAASEYEACIDALSDAQKEGNQKLSFLRAAMGVACPEDVREVMMVNRFLRSQVSEAIVLHNIYPENLPKAHGYRTQLSNQPITFLAILADTLQRWDRPALANEARSAFIGGAIAGSRYNIKIQNDIFHVSLVGERADIQKEQKMRDILRAFLRDADSLVKLQLEES